MAGGGRLEALDFDPVSELVYYIDKEGRALLRAQVPRQPNALGLGQRLVQSLNQPQGLAVDYIGRCGALRLSAASARAAVSAWNSIRDL